MMKKIQSKRSYLYTCLIFIVCMSSIFVLSGFFPFGGKSMLTSDMRSQYVDFFAFFKHNLISDYSFKIGIGSDAIGFFAYYLASPVNLLVFLFDNMEYAAAAIFVLKIALCALSCSLCLKHSFLTKRAAEHDLLLAVLSNCYAFCGFTMMYSMNVIWFDNVYIFPVLILAVEKLVFEHKEYLIYISALNLLVNFYIGIISTIFSVFYIFALYIIQRDAVRKSFGLIIKCFFLGASLSCGLLMPTLIGMSKSKMSSDNKFAQLSDKMGIEISSFFHIILYVWIAVMVIIIITNALKNKKSNISINPKIKNAMINVLFAGTLSVFLFIYILSAKSGNFLSGINKLTYFMPFIYEENAPQLYCGILTVIGLICLLAAGKSIKGKISFLTLLAMSLMPVFSGMADLIFHLGQAPISFPYRYSFAICFFCILFAAYGISEASERVRRKGIFSSKYLRAVLKFVFAAAFTSEICLNAVGAFRYNEMHWFGYDDKESIELFVDESKKALENVNDKGFYRLEKSFMRNINDSMQLNYNGINHYSSMYNISLIDFLARCGCLTTAYFGTNIGQTPLLDTLFGVKYTLETADKTFLDTCCKYGVTGKSYYPDIYKPISSGTVSAYKNENAADFAFKADKDIINLERSSLADNRFENLNTVFNKISGEDIYPYKRQELHENYVNFFSLNASESGCLFISVSPENSDYGNIYVNGGRISSGFSEMFGVTYHNIYCGYFNCGDEITIEIESPFKIDKASVSCYIEDGTAYKRISEKMRPGKFDYKYVSDSEIVLETNSFDGLLVTEIPYDENWKAVCNGEELETENVLGIILGVNLKPEQNCIVFSYKNEGLLLSIFVSASALFYLIIPHLRFNHKKNNQKKGI